MWAVPPVDNCLPHCVLQAEHVEQIGDDVAYCLVVNGSALSHALTISLAGIKEIVNFASCQIKTEQKHFKFHTRFRKWHCF